MVASEGGHTAQLTEFVRDLSFESIPPAATAAARRAVLDSIGCMLAGRDTAVASQAMSVAEVLGGRECAALAGRRKRSSAGLSAFVNAVQANALDYDDAFEQDGKGMGHPGATIVPAALAMAEITGASDRELLTAIIAGYEAANRIIQSLQPTPQRHAQVWGVAVHQAFGSAVAAARLLGLEGETFADAFGLAGTLSTVPAARKWNWTTGPFSTPKDVVAAPAEAGIRAALLAQAGWHGSRDILDGPHGFWIMAGSDRCNQEVITDRLGSRWTVEELSFKPYPACRWTHTALQAVEELLAEGNLSARDILRVDVGSFEDVVLNFANRRPPTMIDAEFSMPWVLAALISGQPRGSAWYSEEALADPALHALCDRVHLHVDEEAQRRHLSDERKTLAHVTVTTSDGRALDRRVIVARGGLASPWPDGGLAEKFRSLTVPALGAAQARELEQTIMALGNGVEMQRLFKLFAGGEQA